MKTIKLNIEEAELSASFILCRKFAFVNQIHICAVANSAKYSILKIINAI